MKKRFVLTACVLLIAVLCACVFVACNGNGDDKKSATYTVSYDLGAYQGEGNAPDSVKVEKDGKLNLPTADKLPAWEGHTFEGWKLNGEGELLAGGTEISVTADAKYVAQWETISEQRQFEAGSIYEVLPEEELKRLIGYVYTMGKQDGYHSSFDVPYTKDGTSDSSGVKSLGYLDIGTSNGEDEAGGMIYFFKSEADAQANRDYWVSYEPEGYEESMKVVGNRIYFGYPSGEEWQAYYENTILKAEIPQSLSETRLEYMLDTVTVAHGTSFVTMELTVSTNYKYDSEATAESGESFMYSLGENDTNRDNIFAFCTVEEANDPTNDVYGGLENKITKYGEEGSSVNKQLENGFVFFRYIEKPGFRYELNSDGATLVKYCFDASSPALIVVPDKVEIDGNTVNVTKIGSNAFLECRMTSVTIPEGVKEIESYVFQNCSKLKTINLPKSLESVDSDWLLGCDSLETLNYAGTSTEWNVIAQRANANGWCTYHDYDDDGNSVEKHISFTVVCSDGVSINYPTQTE